MQLLASNNKHWERTNAARAQTFIDSDVQRLGSQYFLWLINYAQNRLKKDKK